MNPAPDYRWCGVLICAVSCLFVLALFGAVAWSVIP